MPARAQPEKRAEARRLVEEDGLSLAEAADRVKANRGTVRDWQKQDEAAGDPWTLVAERSVAQKAKAEALTDEQRRALTERARRASLAWSEQRRREEAAACGVLAQQLRVQVQNALPRYAASLLEGGDGDTAGARSQRIAAGIKSVGLLYAITLDKADGLAGFGKSGLVVEADPAESTDDVAEAVSLLSLIQDRRARSA